MSLTYQMTFEVREKLEEEALCLEIEPEAEAERIQRWADNHSQRTSVLPPNAMTGEQIYEAYG